MFILVTYDVNTTTSAGRRRLRKVANLCVAHGQRVQNSVFECDLDSAQYEVFRHGLTSLINPEHDSIRIYKLGTKSFEKKVEHYGTKETYQPGDVLML